MTPNITISTPMLAELCLARNQRLGGNTYRELLMLRDSNMLESPIAVALPIRANNTSSTTMLNLHIDERRR